MSLDATGSEGLELTEEAPGVPCNVPRSSLQADFLKAETDDSTKQILKVDAFFRDLGNWDRTVPGGSRFIGIQRSNAAGLPQLGLQTIGFYRLDC